MINIQIVDLETTKQMVDVQLDQQQNVCGGYDVYYFNGGTVYVLYSGTSNVIDLRHEPGRGGYDGRALYEFLKATGTPVLYGPPILANPSTNPADRRMKPL